MRHKLERDELSMNQTMRHTRVIPPPFVGEGREGGYKKLPASRLTSFAGLPTKLALGCAQARPGWGEATECREQKNRARTRHKIGVANDRTRARLCR